MPVLLQPGYLPVGELLDLREEHARRETRRRRQALVSNVCAALTRNLLSVRAGGAEGPRPHSRRPSVPDLLPPTQGRPMPGLQCHLSCRAPPTRHRHLAVHVLLDTGTGDLHEVRDRADREAVDLQQSSVRPLSTAGPTTPTLRRVRQGQASPLSLGARVSVWALLLPDARQPWSVRLVRA